MTDFSSGLAAAEDYALPAPEDIPGFNETYCFFGFDGAADTGFFVHMQARPQPWRLNLLVFLPGGQDFLKTVVFSEDRIQRRPGGDSFHAECLEPFRRWRVRVALDCSKQTMADMLAMREIGPAETPVDLDIVCEATAPLWCIGANDGSTAEEHGQRGFRTHHQQLTHGLGAIRIAGRETRFDGPVWRDHSRGARTLTQWGTHDLNSAWFPKQRRGLGLLRQFDITGRPTNSYAYVVEDGVLEDAEVVECTPLTDVRDPHPKTTVVLRAKSGKTYRMDGVLRAQMLTGIGPGSWLSEGQADWTLNGESALGICERSCRGGPSIADPAIEP
jgi:hypothetical protein